MVWPRDHLLKRSLQKEARRYASEQQDILQPSGPSHLARAQEPGRAEWLQRMAMVTASLSTEVSCGYSGRVNKCPKGATHRPWWHLSGATFAEVRNSRLMVAVGVGLGGFH